MGFVSFCFYASEERWHIVKRPIDNAVPATAYGHASLVSFKLPSVVVEV